MAETKKVTELNQKSLELRDSELALVDKFSVLLPMGELPEIVIVGGPDKSAAVRGGVPAERHVIPFPATLADDGDEGRQRVQTDTRAAVSTSISSSRHHSDAPVVSQSDCDAVSEKAATSTDRSTVDTKLDSGPGDTDEIMAVEFPRDELSISRGRQAGESSLDASGGPELGGEQPEEAIFDLGEHARFRDRMESAAANLAAALPDNRSQVIVLTPPETHPDQGAVFHSLLDAVAAQRPELRIIAVQANEICGATSDWTVGLGHVLAEEHLLEEVVIPTSLENLDYLGYTESSISNASFKNRMQRILDELKGHYDLVLVNGNPATSSQTIALADVVDTFYLLVRLGDSERETVARAVEELRKRGGRLSGCLVTHYQREAS